MTSFARWAEVHRLAVAGGESAIARQVSSRIARMWLRRSRFADVAGLAQATLTLGPDASALHHLGGALSATGQPRQALAYYELALPIAREVGDRAREAVTRYNVAMIHRADGNLDRAIGELELVVKLDRQIDHPDLAADTATLEQLRREQAELRDEA